MWVYVIWFMFWVFSLKLMDWLIHKLKSSVPTVWYSSTTFRPSSSSSLRWARLQVFMLWIWIFTLYLNLKQCFFIGSWYHLSTFPLNLSFVGTNKVLFTSKIVEFPLPFSEQVTTSTKFFNKLQISNN